MNTFIDFICSYIFHVDLAAGNILIRKNALRKEESCFRRMLCGQPDLKSTTIFVCNDITK